MGIQDSQSNSKRLVALFGTFDTDNFGDCLFPLIVRQQLLKRIKDLDLLLISPTHRTPRIANYAVVHAFDELGRLFDAILPAFIIGGGALLSTDHVLFSYPQILFTYPYSLKCWLLPAMAAHAWNCPLILNGVGLGPFDESYVDVAGKYLKQAQVCGVRDEITRDFLAHAGVYSEVIPDSGILTPELESPSARSGRYESLVKELHLPDRYIVVQASLFLGSQLEAFARGIAEAARQTKLPVVLLPICHHLNDLVALRILRHYFEGNKVKTVVVEKILKTLDTSAILSQAALFVGTSLHGALIALSFERPIVSFSLSSMKKNAAVLAVLGKEDRVISETSELPCKIHESLREPRDNVAGLDKARSQLSNFFDRVAEVIWARSGTKLPRLLEIGFSSGKGLGASRKYDLDCIRGLCAQYRRRIGLLRRCGAYIVRNNRVASEWYDYTRYRVTARKPSDAL